MPTESPSLLTSAPTGQKIRVNIELQEDFSMDQALSLYLLDTIPLVDPQQPDYALVLLTLVESILEDPDIILRKQLDRVKDQKMAEMKMEGIEYDQRMEELEKLEYPKPNQEFIYSTFNAFADRHPWVGQENIRPKSIAREMFESFRSFSDYIRDYELQRAEGVLLRHLNRVYKVLAQNVPDAAKNDQIREMELYLGSMIRQVDSSLLDEWEKMRDPNFQRAETKEVRPPGAEEAAQDITRDTKAFTAAIRNRIFIFLRGLVIADYEAALASLSEGRVPRALKQVQPLKIRDSQSSPLRRMPMASRGRPSVCARRWKPTNSNTSAFASTRTRGMPGILTSFLQKTRKAGASSRCWLTRRKPTTGWRNSKWIWPDPALWASHSFNFGASAVWFEPKRIQLAGGVVRISPGCGML